MEALTPHSFPGNVRELENALRRAVALSSSGLLTIDCLPPEIARAGPDARTPAGMPERGLIADRPTMDELQRRYLSVHVWRKPAGTGGARRPSWTLTAAPSSG